RRRNMPRLPQRLGPAKARLQRRTDRLPLLPGRASRTVSPPSRSFPRPHSREPPPCAPSASSRLSLKPSARNRRPSRSPKKRLRPRRLRRSKKCLRQNEPIENYWHHVGCCPGVWLLEQPTQ